MFIMGEGRLVDWYIGGLGLGAALWRFWASVDGVVCVAERWRGGVGGLERSRSGDGFDQGAWLRWACWAGVGLFGWFVVIDYANRDGGGALL